MGLGDKTESVLVDTFLKMMWFYVYCVETMVTDLPNCLVTEQYVGNLT